MIIKIAKHSGRNIFEDMQWFPLQGIMLHTENNINIPEQNLQSLLNLFSMFKFRIWYDETIVKENSPNDVGILCINCGKTIVCLLDNKTIEDFITIFVTNIVFHHISLFWIIQSNQDLNLDFQ